MLGPIPDRLRAVCQAHTREDIKARKLEKLDQKAKEATWEVSMILRVLVNETQEDPNLIFLQPIEPPHYRT